MKSCVCLIVKSSLTWSRSQIVGLLILTPSYADLLFGQWVLSACTFAAINMSAYPRVFAFNARLLTIAIGFSLDDSTVCWRRCTNVLAYNDRLLTIAIGLSLDESSISCRVYIIVLTYTDRFITIVNGFSLDDSPIVLVSVHVHDWFHRLSKLLLAEFTVRDSIHNYLKLMCFPCSGNIVDDEQQTAFVRRSFMIVLGTECMS